MLTEECYLNEIEPTVGNTDGVFFFVDNDKEDKFNEILKWWENITNLTIGKDEYKSFYLRDVNSFIAETPDGLKLKGPYDYISYIEKYGEFDLGGSFSMPIVSYATVKYFTENIPVEDTIKNHIKDYPFDGIYDFCQAKKSGSQFINMLVTIENKKVKTEILQKSIRFFISKSNRKIFKVKDKTDKELIKIIKDFRNGKGNLINTYVVKNEEVFEPNYILIRELNGKFIYVIESLKSKKMLKKEWKSYTDVMVNRNITLLNNTIDSSEYEKLDYTFYIEEANKLIDAIEKFKPPKISKQETLF